MKKTYHLFSVAQKLSIKYAESQSLQEIIESAAGYGENSANGIMNFPAQLKKDNAGLSLAVAINSSPLGGKKVTVSPPIVDPPEVAGNYTKLPEQIKKYLEKNLKYFPQITLGTTVLDFSKDTQGEAVAANQIYGRN